MTQQAILKCALVGACLAVLGGCGGGGYGAPSVDVSGDAGFCDSIAGGGSTLTASCTGCTVANKNAAADGNLGTYADIQMSSTATNETATFRAKAQNGVTFPGGGKAGEFVSEVGSSSGSSDTTIRTYMLGIVQDIGTPSISVTRDGVYFYINTTRQYDAVEVVTHNSRQSLSDSPPGYQIYEICSNGGAR